MRFFGYPYNDSVIFKDSPDCLGFINVFGIYAINTPIPFSKTTHTGVLSVFIIS